MKTWIRPVMVVLIAMALLTIPARADDFDFAKIYPDHVYWISEGFNSNLEAATDGTLAAKPASAARGQFWQFKSLGDKTYVVTSLLVGPQRSLSVKNGRLVFVNGAQTLRVFNDGDRFVFKLPEPGDLTRHPPGGVTFTLMRMQSAQDPLPTAGNYYTNVGKVQGSRGGALWQVVAPGLSGREKPDLHSRQVRTFTRGTVLQADIGRGGSDEVNWNATDDHGNSWMRVRSRDGKDLNSYVRANSKYIQPVTK